MTLLVVKNCKAKYLENMQNSESAKIQTKYVLQRFETFCQQTQNKSEDEVIEELKILKKTKSEDEYKQVLYNTILQPFINELGKFYDPSALRGLFSYFKGYLVSWGIIIYREESKIFLKFPKRCEDAKHVFTKPEVRSICNVSSPKRRMLYLVLSSSAMRIQETIRLRKKDIEVSDGKVTIQIKAPYTKTKQERHTFISQEASELLIPHLATLEDNDLVFGVNENPKLAKAVEESTFTEYRKKAGFCNCEIVGIKNCIGKYTSSKQHKITLHSFRSYAISAVNRQDFGLGNSLAGHGYYMKNYDRMEIEEKRAIYKLAEPRLNVYATTEATENLVNQNKMLLDQIARLQERMDLMDKKP